MTAIILSALAFAVSCIGIIYVLNKLHEFKKDRDSVKKATSLINGFNTRLTRIQNSQNATTNKVEKIENKMKKMLEFPGVDKLDKDS